MVAEAVNLWIEVRADPGLGARGDRGHRIDGLPSTRRLSTAPGVEATGLTRANHAVGHGRFQARKVPMSAP